MSHSITSVLRRAWKRVSTATSRSATAPRRSPHRAKLAVEAFEDRVVPATVFSVDQFEDNIRSFFVNNSVGFAYSIAQDGAIVRHDGWGDARTEEDGQVDFTEDTKMTSASVAKTITATAILKILQHDPDISLDSFISPYLPTLWIPGPNINTITFRDLLTHHSGLRRIDFDASGSDGTEVDYNGDGFGDYGGASLDEQTLYNGLKQIIENGIIPADEDLDGFIDPLDADFDGQIDRKVQFSYENANFALMRVMTAYLLGNGDLADTADEPDVYTADAYVAYVRDNVLTPMGIDNADTKPSDDNDTFALNYPYPADDAPGANWDDRKLWAGGEGWWLSADEYAQFLIGLRSNDDVLFPEVREQMRDGFLGLMDPDHGYGFSEGMFGTYYSHGGDLNNLHTGIIDFPNGVQASLLINCDFTGAPYQLEALKRAYENAWPEIDINGTADNDTFEVRLNVDDPNAIDIFLNGDLVVRRWIETLDTLTINGLGGNDTFTIEDLPESVDLILDGGADDDSFLFANQVWFSTFPYVAGNVNIVGGTGHDSIDINEGNSTGLGSDYAITGINNPELTVQGSIDATNYTPGKLFLYEGVEDLVLWANIDPNQIAVTGIANPMTIAIHAGENHDTIRVANIDAGVAVNVYGGFGNDTLILGDGKLGTLQGTVFFEGGNGADLIVLDDADAPAPAGRDYNFNLGKVTASDGFGEVTYSTGVENVRLHASSGDDTVNVESLGATTDLELYGHDGTDVFRIARLSENIDAVLGDVVIHGGNGYPPSHLPPMAFPEDDDQLYVRDGNNLVAGIYTINLHLGNVLVGRFNKLGGNPSELPPNVIYDQIERTELHTGNADDTITVVAAPRFNQVSVFAGPGMDQIDVESTPLFAPMKVFGEGGDDTIRVSPIANKLGNLHSLLSVNGGSGAAGDLDTLTIDDSLSDNVATYSLGGSSLTRPGSAGVAFEAVEHLVVSLSDAANVINVSATVAGTMVDIFGKAGNDTLTASNLASSVTFFGGAGLDDSAYLIGTNGPDTITITGNTMTLGAGSLTSLVEYREADGRGGMDTFQMGSGDLDSIGLEPVLFGGDDSDALIINDQDDLGNDAYTVAINEVSKPNFLLLYDEMETLTLNAGADNNMININSTKIGTPVVINAGDGGDIIHFSPIAQNLSLIDGHVTVNGQLGVDTVFLHDESFALGGFFPYTLTRSTVSRSFFGGLDFDTIERLRLNLGSGNNTVNVTQFNPDVLFALYGNVGKDTFNVTVFPALGDTGGRLFIDGGGNVDRVNVVYASKPEVPEKPKVTHKKNLPGAGTITVEYLAALYDIQYTGLEVVTVDKI